MLESQGPYLPRMDFLRCEEGEREEKRRVKDVHMIALLADDGLCVMTDVYENLRISGGRLVCWRGDFWRQNMSRTWFHHSLFPPILPSRDHSPGQREQEQDLRRRRYGGGPCCLACEERMGRGERRRT